MDERDIEAELKALKKLTKGQADKEVTTRLRKVLLEVDGKTERGFINKFVDNNFLAVDSLALRNYLKTLTPDIDMSYNFECSLCTYEEEVTVPMTVQFFWPSTKS